MYEQVVVLVGTERHLHAEIMAVETVKAARPAGLASVAALLLSSGERIKPTPSSSAPLNPLPIQRIVGSRSVWTSCLAYRLTIKAGRGSSSL